ncbi:nitrate reductase molybdenum cofactor assembly chaperone [Virgibacillus ainsalahensis]
MDRNQSLNVYQMLSFLLQYPNRQMVEALPEMQREIDTIEEQQIQNHIKKFIEIASSTPLDNWIDYYVENFDFGRLTNLYITYLKLGEQRERGLELLKLKKFYEASGFEVTDKELTDYLPLILEFCGNVPAEKSSELLQMHVKAIHAIRDKLAESDNHYVLLFDALTHQMEKNGVSILPEENSTPAVTGK